MGKKVSIIIPTYKRATTLKRAVDSVLAQDYENFEIIVVDDNDPDTSGRIETEGVMAEYAGNDKVKYIKHPHNKNGSAARNTGFRASSGEYIMFLDDDDEFMSGKIKAQAERLSSLSDEWGLCYCQYKKYRAGKLASTSIEKREGDLLKDSLGRNLFIAAGSNLMIKRTVFEEVNGFDESFRRNQDQELLARILKKYKIAYTDVYGLRVNMHENEKTNIDFEKLTEQYLGLFGAAINELSDEDKKVVYKLLDLQRFRFMFFKRRQFKKAFKLIRSKKISFFDAVSYTFHLWLRRLRKVSVGYSVK